MPDPHYDEHISWLHNTVHFLMDKWQAFMFLMSLLVGGSLWYLHQTFASKKSLKTVEKENEDAHSELKSSTNKIHADVSWIKGFLERHNHTDKND